MFITTANTLDTDPRAAARPHGDHPARRLHRGGEARDRQALPRAAPDRAQRAQAVADRASPTPALRAIIADYTREAGVRNLEREIGTVCRKVARQVAEGTRARARSPSPRRAPASCSASAASSPTPAAHAPPPGVATGLAWTPVGGDVLFVEATGDAGLGQAHDHRPARRRDEGVRAGGALLRARARRASSRPSCPRTGSRRTTSTSTCPPARSRRTARAPASRWPRRSSRCSPARRVRDDVAMTGEITLTGQVLPIGGLKEKALAAQRNGIKRVIAPRQNEADVDEIPEHLRARPRVRLRLRHRRGARRRARGRGRCASATAPRARRAPSPERRAARGRA